MQVWKHVTFDKIVLNNREYNVGYFVSQCNAPDFYLFELKKNLLAYFFIKNCKVMYVITRWIKGAAA